MPLLDHFHPPISERRHWDGFHSAWANAIVEELNGDLLPQRYFAEPHVRWGGGIEVDVATFERLDSGGRGGVGTALWAPPAAGVRLAVDGLDQDVVEVRIIREEGGPDLVAAIELVSPANKDRPETRRAFVAKCVAYLQVGISVVVVDVVTSRTYSLHADLLRSFDAAAVVRHMNPLYAAAYRTHADDQGQWLEAWPEPLRVGTPLPTLPLWLTVDEAVPLDLDQSYTSTCRTLRMEGFP